MFWTTILFTASFVFAQSPATSDDDGLAAAQAIMSGAAAVDGLATAGRVKPQDADCKKAKPAPYPTTSFEGANGKPVEVSVLPESELKNLFYFSTTLGLPLKNRKLCSQRAHVTAYEWLNSKGIKGGKLMIEPARTLGFVTSPMVSEYPDGRRYNWDYHVVPFVAVERNGKYEQWVIDPSTFTRPVKREEWEKFMKNSGNSYVTDRFALDLRDLKATDLDYSGRRSIGHTLQVIEENRGK